jgi:hypothetical protein
MKTVEYYNTKIESLKATIKRLQAEKRIAILRQRERLLKTNCVQAIKGQADGR